MAKIMLSVLELALAFYLGVCYSDYRHNEWIKSLPATDMDVCDGNDLQAPAAPQNLRAL